MKFVSLSQLPESKVSHNPAIKKKVMLRMGDLPGLTQFSQAIFAPGEIAKAHAHEDMYEVFFVESGQGVIRVNDQPYKLASGDCISVEPREIHEIENTGTNDLVLTYFGIQTA